MLLAQHQTSDLFKTIVARVNASLAFLEAVETGKIRLPMQTCASVLQCQMQVLRQYDAIRGWFSRKDKKEAGACDDKLFHLKLVKTGDLLIQVQRTVNARMTSLLLSTNTWIAKAHEAEQAMRLEDAEWYYSHGLKALADLMEFRKPQGSSCGDCARTIVKQNCLLRKLASIRKILAERAVLQTVVSAA